MPSKKELAAEVMQLTPENLLKQEVIEGIIDEPEDHDQVCENIDRVLQNELSKLEELSDDELLEKRYERFRKF